MLLIDFSKADIYKNIKFHEIGLKLDILTQSHSLQHWESHRPTLLHYRFCGRDIFSIKGTSNFCLMQWHSQGLFFLVSPHNATMT